MDRAGFLPNFPELLSVTNREYAVLLLEIWSWWLKSDNFAEAGLDSIRPGETIQADLLAGESGVFAGGEELLYVCKHLFDKIKIDLFFDDGDFFNAGDVLLRVTGDSRQLLFVERTLINFLARMSGIASQVAEIKGSLKQIQIAATRKTLWGVLDKKAVVIGGGLTHRLSFTQALIIKDNDWSWFDALLKMDKSQKLAAEKLALLKDYAFLEVEVENESQFQKFLLFVKSYLSQKNVEGLPPLGVMFDNIAPRQLAKYLDSLPDDIFVEVSGGITKESLATYDLPKIDFASLGSLTKSAKSLDFSLSALD